jgi:hypothetical protein
MIHGFGDFSDLNQPVGREMPALLADSHTPRELFEIIPLRCTKRIRLEEGDDHPKEILPSTHGVAMQVLLVVVVPPVDADGTNPKEALHIVQRADAFGTLNYHKTVSHLKSGLVASSTFPVWLPNEAD